MSLPRPSRVALSLCCVLAPSLRATASAAPAFPPLTEVEKLPADIEWLEEGAWGDYDLRVQCHTGGNPAAEALIVLNRVDDANHYRLLVSATASRLERVESGLRLVVATGKGLGEAKSVELLVKRRRDRIELFVEGRSLLMGHDATFDEGAIGCAASGGMLLTDARLQPVQAISFNDDFMRAEGEAGDWETVAGLWSTRSLLNPFRSANAFTYAGVAHNQPAVAVAGHWFWDDYQFTVAAKSSGEKPFGAIVGWRGAGNYVLFEWTCRTGTKRGFRRLVAVTEGKEHELARAEGGFRTDQWYRLSLTLRRGLLLASVDDVLTCAARVPSLPGGKVGLYTRNYKATYFDDVSIQSTQAVTSDFSATGDLASLSGGAWEVLGGTWRCLGATDAGGLCEAVPAGTARALIGDEDWADYRVTANVAPGDAGAAGLYCYFHDADNHLSLQLQSTPRPTVSLVRTSEGKPTTLASAELRNPKGAFTRLALDADRGVLSAGADGEALFEVAEDTFLSGRAGLLAAGETPSRFADFSLEFPEREPAPVFTIHETFEGEVSMANWAAAQSDWNPVKTKVGSRETEVQWHRAVFWGPVEVQAEADLSKGAVTLVTAAARPLAGTGYELRAAAEGLALLREGKEVARAKLTGKPDVYAVRLRRARNVVSASLDGALVLTFAEAAPLAGTHVAWHATNNAASVGDIQVYSANVVTDNFRSAPIDWREGGGWWAVSRRWQCDPRWSFFSGLNAEGSAVLWHKRPLKGDQVVEFAAGVKMARQHGDYAAYGRDLNMVLCADGRDTTSGYSFVFGGWGNTKTAIVRRAEVVAEAPPPKFSYAIHRRWFLLRAEKRGGHLAFYVDNAKVCEYDDPQPLTGDRLGLWTQECGMMVSRFRMCAEEIGPLESVDEAWPATSKTFYEVAE